MRLLSLTFVLCICTTAFADTVSKPLPIIQYSTEYHYAKIPRVFQIGENPEWFEQLDMKYSTLLYTACDDDMNLAHDKWKGMLKELEGYSRRIGYDVKGVKLWLKVCWNKKGYIEHIAYSIKPNSRNIDRDVFEGFLIRFMQGYRLDLRSREGFSHYTSVSFPIY